MRKAISGRNVIPQHLGFLSSATSKRTFIVDYIARHSIEYLGLSGNLDHEHHLIPILNLEEDFLICSVDLAYGDINHFKRVQKAHEVDCFPSLDNELQKFSIIYS